MRTKKRLLEAVMRMLSSTNAARANVCAVRLTNDHSRMQNHFKVDTPDNFMAMELARAAAPAPTARDAHAAHRTHPHRRYTGRYTLRLCHASRLK